MRLAGIALAFCGAALVFLLILGGTVLKEREESATAGILAPATAKARSVNPTLVAQPPVEGSELNRAEPRGPLGDIALALPPPPGAPEKTLLYRPVATAAGRLEAEGHKIALDGIVTLEPDEQCSSADGSSWPCGMVARTAFRNWLRGRAIECIVGEPAASGTVISDCRLGKQDVALWLVENGLASAEPGGAYVDAEEKAKAERRGIFGPGPSVRP